MATAEKMRQISAAAESDKYWTIEAYVRNLKTRMENYAKNCANSNVSGFYWVPSVDLGSGNLVPDRKRMDLIVPGQERKSDLRELAAKELVFDHVIADIPDLAVENVMERRLTSIGRFSGGDTRNAS